MSEHQVPAGKFMLDPYLDWAAKEGVPIYEDFGLNLLALQTKPWPRYGVKGAIAHVQGRGDFMTVFVLDIPPGGSTAPQKHIFEAAFYVLSGYGSTEVKLHSDEKQSFEWGVDAVFAPPLNTQYRIFNGSGTEPARIAVSNNLPAVLNLFHNEKFVFENSGVFPEREGPPEHFRGSGDFIGVRPGKHMWETNFLPNVKDFKLQEWAARGAGGSHIQLILSDGVMHSHISEMPVGTYKKAHRHTPDTHVYCVSGEGYSLLWYEGDKDFVKVDWSHGWVFAPPDKMFHQHFNACTQPVRYLAFAHGSVRYPFTEHIRQVYKGVDLDVKKGGNQIEYADQDPRIHQLFVAELAKKGLKPRMEQFVPNGAGQPAA